MHLSSSLVALLKLQLISVASASLLVNSCTDSTNYPDTCSPTQCVLAPNAACSPTASTANAVLGAAAITCKTCTQSTDSRCSTAALIAMFGKYPAVKRAYCNDLFLVIHSDNVPNHADSLAKIPHPPAGGDAMYVDSCVTRSRNAQYQIFKIPLTPATELPAAATNNMDVMTANGIGHIVGAGLPSSGSASNTISGMPIYPPYNDQSGLTWRSCEMDR